MNGFKEMYQKAKLMGELDAALGTLSVEEMEKLEESLRTVHTYTGLDMRQELVMKILKYRLEDMNGVS